MDSGIYRLYFLTGEIYVGQSQHIPKRWQQHNKALTTGKHTKKLQEAYRRSGNQLPITSVLCYCHPHVLDLYETYFIYRLSPQLNSAETTKLSDQQLEVLRRWLELDYSNNCVPTIMHTALTRQETIRGLQDTVGVLRDTLDAWETEERVMARWDAQVQGYLRTIGALQLWQDRARNLGWWDRLWGRWPQLG